MICPIEAILFLAQANGDAPDTSTASIFASLIVTWLPFLIIFSFIFFPLRKMLKRSSSSVERSLDHMTAMQSKTDEMIELLRSINDKLDRNG